MAPYKKKKGTIGSGTSTPHFDASYFKSIEHEAQYNNVILDKSFVRERWLKIPKDEYLEINSHVIDKGWGILYAKPDNGCEGLVQEFYANA